MKLGGLNMHITKYPIISRHNCKYKVKIERYTDERYRDVLTCYLYKVICFIPIKVYEESANYISIRDLKDLVRGTVESYEYLKGYGQQVHYKLDDFKEWNGDLR